MTRKAVARKNTNLLSAGRRGFLLTALSGLLLSLAFNLPSLWFFGFVALAPLLFVLKNTTRLRTSVLHGFTFGLIYFGSVLSFFFSAHPLDWAGIENKTVSFLGISTIWLLASAALAAGPALWAGVIHKTKNHKFLIFLAPALWVITEIFQASLFSIIFVGEDGLVGPHWTFGFIGYVLAENTFLLSLAALGGVYILSFVVVFLNITIGNFFVDKKIRGTEVAGTLLILILAGAFFLHSPEPTGERRVAVLYTNFKPGFLQDINDQANQLIETGKLLQLVARDENHFDIVVLPENTFFFSRLSRIDLRYHLNSLSRDGEVLIIDSVRTDVPGKDKSNILFLNSKEDEVSTRTKRLLVPQGEYLSYAYTFLGKLFLGSEWLETFNDRRSLERGDEMVLGISGDISVGALFCSEALTPNLYRDATKGGAGLLVNAASHSVFSNSENLYQQIIKYSKLRAVENGRYYVQAGNGVPSFVVNHKGRVIGKTATKEGAVLKATAFTFNHKTPFTRAGTEGVLVVLLTSSTLLFLLGRQRRK